MGDLNMWQTLLWIAALLMIAGPIIAIWVNVMIIGYFRAKEQHINRTLGAFAKATEQVANLIGEKMKQKEKTEKNG